MKAKVLGINWHDQEPVYSLDFVNRETLATAGGDKEVRIETSQSGSPEVKFLHTLTTHTKAVNCVRFSPSGMAVATGGDGGDLSILKADLQAGGQGTSSSWKRFGMLRGHAEDVQDLAWAPDDSALVSGSVENSCIIWDVEAGKGKIRLEDHKHFVQGVAWEPSGRSIVSLSCDRTARIYGPRRERLLGTGRPAIAWVPDATCQHVISKAAASVDMHAGQKQSGSQQGAGKAAGRQLLFHDETLSTFFRRPAWSPDGSILILPAGMTQQGKGAAQDHAAHAFKRGSWASPAFYLPAVKPVVAVRFCPVLFKLRQPHASDNLAFQLPYRMVFALATLDSIVVYDTQAMMPLAMLGSLHYDRITDLAWSTDGQLLAASSYDGYCSIATFTADDLGQHYPTDQLPMHIQTYLAAATKSVQCEPKPAGSTQAAQNQPSLPSATSLHPAGTGLPAAVQRGQGSAWQAAGLHRPLPSKQQDSPTLTAPLPPRRIVPQPQLVPAPVQTGTAGGRTLPAGVPSPMNLDEPSAHAAQATSNPGCSELKRPLHDVDEPPAKQARRIMPQAVSGGHALEEGASGQKHQAAMSMQPPTRQAAGMSIAALAAAAGLAAAQPQLQKTA